ncbi:MAG TPA: VOC family protein [Terracidiphilus sp.]|nr:VOC family protein [Terracidiphilus sp.]
MSQSGKHHAINYIEFASTDIEAMKRFYSTVFGWSFEDYGPEYTSFDANAAGLSGGFYKSDAHAEQPKYAPLVVLYSTDLKATEAAVVSAGGAIDVAIFEFPGGRRFHFSDGCGNVLAVWSE